MNRLFFICVNICLIIGCSSQIKDTNQNAFNYYEEIESEIRKYNSQENQSQYYKTNKFNPVDYIFRNLDDKLKNTNHLVFLFSWVNHLPTAGTKHFVSIIHDVSNNKNYYCYNSIDNYRKIFIEEIIPQNYTTANAILENYKQNKISYLKTLQNKFITAEMGQDYLIFEIDFTKKANKLLVLKSVMLEN